MFTRGIDPGVDIQLVTQAPYALSPLLSAMNTVHVLPADDKGQADALGEHVVEHNGLLDKDGKLPFDTSDSIQRRRFFGGRKGGDEMITYRNGLYYSFDIFGYALLL